MDPKHTGLIEKVNKHLDSGWYVIGGVSVIGTVSSTNISNSAYHQAMAK